MKIFKLLLVISIFILTNKCFSQSNWFIQNSGTSYVFRNLWFNDQQTGWATGWYGTTVKTTNGGNNWILQNTNTLQHFISAFFLNNLTGWISGGDMPSGATLIEKTTNGGTNWSIVYSANIGIVFRTFFVSQFTGFSVTSMGHILRSTDSGNNWENLYTNSNYTFTQCFFLDQNTGWVIGDNGTILKTINGGSNFSQQYCNTNLNLEGIYFTSEFTGYITGMNGTYLKTTNAGQNWLSKFSGSSLWLNSIFFINNNTGWIAGGDTYLFDDKNNLSASQILKTTDAGETWVPQLLPTTNALACVSFVNSQTGWAAGVNGTIIKTTNGGSTFIRNNSSDIPINCNLHQNYPNPFNPSTNIRYEILKTGFVKLVVFNALGRETETLVNEKQNSGTYEATFNASQYPSGVYFYRLTTDNFSDTKKMVILK
jgi:photosystem II stability/assembly factor-like uncharacterized protein